MILGEDRTTGEQQHGRSFRRDWISISLTAIFGPLTMGLVWDACVGGVSQWLKKTGAVGLFA
jgi:hypothetical protein